MEKQKIEDVIRKLEAGEISEGQAHYAIAEIAADLPVPEIASAASVALVLSEIDKLDISEEEKQTLKNAITSQ
jgi:hypothetical protein